jgi:3-oxoadipate enol-lactonase
MPRIELSNGALRYEISGSRRAPVLLLSNSLGTTLEMWEPQLKEFERHFQVVRYDVRGHGKSSTPAGPYSIEQLGGDIIALLDGLGIESVYFCGLSIGGLLGQWLGIRTPIRIRKLVLCNTAAKIGSANIWNARIATVQGEGMPAIVDAAVGRWFTASFRASEAPVVDKMRQMLAATDPMGYVATCAALRDTDLRAEVTSIVSPTLIIGGEYDVVTTLDDARFLESRIAGAELVSLPAAHISNAEVPEQFNAAVLQFLTE